MLVGRTALLGMCVTAAKPEQAGEKKRIAVVVQTLPSGVSLFSRFRVRGFTFHHLHFFEDRRASQREYPARAYCTT